MPDDFCPICVVELFPVRGRMYCPNCHNCIESCCEGGDTGVGGTRPDPKASGSP